MADLLRNECSITFDGVEHTLRASFEALRGIERQLKMNLVPLISQFGRGDVGVEQLAVVIYWGLLGYGDSRYTLDQVGEIVIREGVAKLSLPVVNFLAKAMEGVSVGKSQTAGE